MKIFSFLNAIAGFLAGLFRPEFWELLFKGIEVASPYLEVAYGFAKTAAAMTPNRTDDEILALADKLGVPALLQSGTDRGLVIGQIVLKALQLKFPEATTRALNRAMEVAYGAVNP